MQHDPFRVVVIDDHPLFRDGVARTIGESADLDLVGEGDNADDAFALVQERRPDIVCLDISMPGGGIEAARRIGDAFPDVKIVMLTVSEADEDVTRSLEAGAWGYILKGIGGDQLVEALVGVADGRSYITPELATRLLDTARGARRCEPVRPIDTLTRREDQILELVAKGLTNREVGERLDLQEKTVKHYMSSILQKLHVRNRVEAALVASGRSFRA